MKTTPTDAPAEAVADATTPLELVTDPDPRPFPAAADETAPSAPRRRGRPPKAKTATTAAATDTNAGGRPSNSTKLKRSLTDQYTMIGQIVALVAPDTGRAMIERAEECAASLASWADTNAAVRRQLERVNNAAGLAGVLMAHAPIAFIAYRELTAGPEPVVVAGSTPADLWTTPAFG